jgi:hypothetical protein
MMQRHHRHLMDALEPRPLLVIALDPGFGVGGFV